MVKTSIENSGGLHSREVLWVFSACNENINACIALIMPVESFQGKSTLGTPSSFPSIPRS
jgi:hypothetical protein